MNDNPNPLTAALNASLAADGCPEDAARDAWQEEQDRRDAEREQKWLLATMAGRHPYQHLADAPGVPGGKNAHLPPPRPADAPQDET